MLKLWLSGEAPQLTARHVSVVEGISSLFEAVVVARSADCDVDLEAFIARPAAIAIGEELAPISRRRVWRGLCSAAEQIGVEPDGLSTYEIRIAPPLWLLSQRVANRVFQHLSVPEIVSKVIAEWGVEATWHVDASAHPRLDYRVQYGETDFAFVSRLLEEAGIAYTFGEQDGEPRVLFGDALERGEHRAGGPVRYDERPPLSSPDLYVTAVRLAHAARPGKVLLQDFDFRRRLDQPLAFAAGVESSHESRFEQQLYVRGSSFSESDEAARGPGERQGSVAREPTGRAYAARALEAARGRKRVVRFRTNALDLGPGAVFSIERHRHSELAADQALLVTEARITASHEGVPQIECEAVFADTPYRPARTTPRPLVHGVESAVVVGPQTEEIHTDEHGRVRVQFPWDREGRFDESSSCWIRVSQGWAGAGHGLVALPRVGQEVIVGFFGGDPDQPIVVGRVFNVTSPVPYSLPLYKTKTTWRSSSTNGGEGWNEISFEDARGEEQVFLQAERSFDRVVKADESATIGGRRAERVAGDAETEIGGTHLRSVGGSERVEVGGDRTVSVAGSVETSARDHAFIVAPAGETAAAQPTGIEVEEGKITLSTGEAKLTLEGPNISIQAAASLLLSAAANITIAGRADIHVASSANVIVRSERGDLILEGGPRVHVNSRPALSDGDPSAMPVDVPEDVDVDTIVEEAQEMARFDPDAPDALGREIAEGGAWDPSQWGPEHRDFGFFVLGLVAAEAGIPTGVMARQMGMRAQARGNRGPANGDPGNGLFGGKAPFGNDPAEYELIRSGVEHHARRYA